MSRKLDSAQEDQHDIFAKNVGEKLRHLDPMMRILAEKLINDVLFEAHMGSLNRRAYISIPSFDNSNYSNRFSFNESYNITEPTYHQSVQIQAPNVPNSNVDPSMQRRTDLNLEQPDNSLGKFFSSYQ